MSNSRSPHPKGYVIFDLDGTLVDNLDLIAKSFNFAVREFVKREFSREEVYGRFGPTLEQMVMEAVPNESAKDAVEMYHAHYRQFFQQYARIYSGIPALITGLKNAGIQIAVCTASDGRMTNITLEESGFRDVFSVVVTADDVSRVKPNPEGLTRTLELTGGRRDQAIYLGDSVRDIDASRRAGISSAAVLWGFGNRDELQARRPDFVFKDPYDALGQLT